MKIIADENMPNAKRLFSHWGSVELVNGRALTSEQLKGADVLLVRSVTKVTEALLGGSAVRFVGSATIGVDHVDQDFLRRSGVGFSSAPGCNADAVADYVLSGLCHLYMTKRLTWLDKKIGIIGCGNVGKTVYDRFVAMGCQVCVYDPIKQSSEDNINYVGVEEVLACDIISLHAPLTSSGPFPSQNMIGKRELAMLSAGTVVVSAGRGGVINEEALLSRYRELDGDLHLIVDVWDAEPKINQKLLDIVDIGTPHIAGYSKQGREKGTWMIYQAMCSHFQLDLNQVAGRDAISSGWLKTIDVGDSVVTEELIARCVQAIYDVARDDVRLRFKYRENKESNVFDWLRKHYVERDEFNTCLIVSQNDDARLCLKAAGFNVEK